MVFNTANVSYAQLAGEYSFCHFSGSLGWHFEIFHVPVVFLSVSLADEISDLTHQGRLEYDSIIGTGSLDLDRFNDRGGKIITWHGLADPIIPPQGTMFYYQKVLARDPSAADFYRQFYSPGVGHCSGGTGVLPINALDQLRA